MIDQVRPSELSAWLKSHAGNEKPVLLDVREPWELQVASVSPGDEFELVAIPMNQIPARIDEIDASRAVACLCHHGARSLRVAMFLAGNGFETVANVAGGIDLWSAERDAAVPRY
jgi:rhodanese-related sulfurtransferase